MLESAIRDYLADHLDLLEAGLRLLRKEHRLTNAIGTSGRVDILARDRHGVLVLIEVKRANKTAREALHEVSKYVALLQREQGLGVGELRAVVVSTVWDELRVPFDHQVREVDYDLRGYQLVVDDATQTIVRADLVQPLPRARSMTMSRAHHMWFFADPAEREAAWPRIVRRAAEVGAEDLVGFDFDHSTPDETYGPYLLYLALAEVDADDPRCAALARYTSVETDDYASPAEAMCFRVLAELSLTIQGVPFGQDAGKPELFSQLLGGRDGWVRVGAVRRAGVFATSVEERPDEDLLRLVAGHAGLSQVMFAGSSTPANKQHWRDFRQRIRGSLAGNDVWGRVLDDWLDRMVEPVPQLDVMVIINNPCDLIGVLVSGWPDRLHHYLPVLNVGLFVDEGQAGELSGHLIWRGEVVDVDMAVGVVYHSAERWLLGRMFGEVWCTDEELLDWLDLEYAVFLEVGDEPPLRLRVVDGEVVWEPAELNITGVRSWSDAHSFQQFVAAHRDQLGELIASYRLELGLT